MAETKKWVFIVNPISGNNFGATMVPVLEEKIKQFGIDGEIVQTERHGHASEITEEYHKKGFHYFIAVGGDGTIHEVGRACVGKKDFVFGVVPAGTGNDFNQNLGFPDRFEEKHWEIFFQEHILNMDYGKCNGMPFMNGMGLGFDAEVAAKNYVEPGGETVMGGKGKYVRMILSTLFFFKEYNVTVTNNGETYDTPCFINTISIGRRYAGGFYLTPLAIANDGLLDVCMIKKLGLLKRLDILLKVSKGKHTNDKKVNYYRTNKITVDFHQKVPYHADGEVYYDTKFDVEIFPGQLPVLYNPDGDHYFDVKS